MSKSYAQMADEILGGALTDSTKNPYDPNTGHQAHMPAMNPEDKLMEMSDKQRHAFLKNIPGVEVQELKEETIVESQKATEVSVSPQEVDTLNEALRIIQKIQEATTVGNLGVNFAGGQQGLDPKKATVPGNTNITKKAPKKREKIKNKKASSDFLAYLKA